MLHNPKIPLLATMSLSQRSRSPAILKPSTAGFTLVEMLVVLVIIGMVMGLVGPRVLSYLSNAKEKTARIQIASFANSLDMMYADVGRYPNSREGLGALIQRPPGVDSWRGPYLKGSEVPNDPWGNPYVYRSPGSHGAYDIVSYGSDGREGGDDAAADVTSWTQH
jgi:general secretion pathway protein G